jgi:hypothetical protein
VCTLIALIRDIRCAPDIRPLRAATNSSSAISVVLDFERLELSVVAGPLLTPPTSRLARRR